MLDIILVTIERLKESFIHSHMTVVDAMSQILIRIMIEH